MQCTLDLAGPVRLTGPRGEPLTPRGMKTRGLLALLGTARGLKMTRAALQDRLWSESEPEHGSASLRQALAELRRALDRAPDAGREILVQGPAWVGLDPARLRVVLDPPPGYDPGEGRIEFAQDLDIADAEFEDWVRGMRSACAARWEDKRAAAQPDAVRLCVIPPAGALPEVAIVAGMVLDDIVTNAGEMMSLIVTDEAPGAYTLACSAIGDASGFMLHLKLCAPPFGKSLWSASWPITLATAQNMLPRIATAAALELVQAVSRGQPGAALPVTALFSFDRERLMIADKHLSRLREVFSPGIALAWRAYVRHTMLLERLAPDEAETRAEAGEMIAQAQALAPHSPTALAVAALLALWDKRPSYAYELLSLALRQNPTHALAHFAMPGALADLGQDQEAYRHTVDARQAMYAFPSHSSWLFRNALAALRLGRFGEALAHADAAVGFAPEFRPALRAQAALRYHFGDETGAAAAVAQLKRLEPDFSLDLMASDAYPVSTLRAAGLLAITRSGLG